MSSQIYKEASTYVFFTSLQETKLKHNMLLVIADELREQMKERAGNEGKKSPFLPMSYSQCQS